jgi:hypothetical protein
MGVWGYGRVGVWEGKELFRTPTLPYSRTPTLPYAHTPILPTPHSR